MPRPSHQIDRRLIEAGRAILEEEGFQALTVRRLATRARVNPGMFHYHFKTKRGFKRKVLQAIYEDFFKELHVETLTGQPEARLRRALRFIARFARDRRQLLIALMRDAVDRDRETLAFLKDNVFRHVSIILEILGQCQRRGTAPAAPLPTLMSTVMGVIGSPSLMFAAFEHVKAERPLGVPLDKLAPMMISDAAIELRLDVLLKGLRAAAKP